MKATVAERPNLEHPRGCIVQQSALESTDRVHQLELKKVPVRHFTR